MYPVNFRMHNLIHPVSLIAPWPLFTAHGRLDPLFRVSGYEEFESTMASLYESYRFQDQFRNLLVESGHKDSDLLRAESVQWRLRASSTRIPKTTGYMSSSSHRLNRWNGPTRPSRIHNVKN